MSAKWGLVLILISWRLGKHTIKCKGMQGISSTFPRARTTLPTPPLPLTTSFLLRQEGWQNRPSPRSASSHRRPWALGPGEAEEAGLYVCDPVSAESASLESADNKPFMERFPFAGPLGSYSHPQWTISVCTQLRGPLNFEAVREVL